MLVAAVVAAAGPRPEPAGAAFPGANGKIAFASDRDGDYEIYVMNADGTGVTRLTNSPGEDGGTAWSPDGTKIAFASDRDGNYETYVMNADGTGVTQLTTHPGVDGIPDWQPLVAQEPTETPTPTATAMPTSTPTRPPSVGGLSLDPGSAGLPFRASETSGRSVWLLASVAAAVAAGAVALGGAAWRARRRPT